MAKGGSKSLGQPSAFSQHISSKNIPHPTDLPCPHPTLEQMPVTQKSNMTATQRPLTLFSSYMTTLRPSPLPTSPAIPPQSNMDDTRKPSPMKSHMCVQHKSIESKSPSLKPSNLKHEPEIKNSKPPSKPSIFESIRTISVLEQNMEWPVKKKRKASFNRLVNP